MTAPRDPFAPTTSTPAVSFKGLPDNTVQSIVVTEAAKVVQSRDMAGDPLYWVPGQRGKKSTTPSDQPCNSAVLAGESVGTVYTKDGAMPEGTPVSLWAGIPSDLGAKIYEAQQKVRPGYQLKPGDRVDVAVVGHEDTGKGNPKSLHAVRIVPDFRPPAPAAPASDPFGPSASTTSGDPWANVPPPTDEPPF